MKKKGILLVAVILLGTCTLSGCGGSITHLTDTDRDLIEGDPPWKQRLIKDKPTGVPVKTDVTRGLESPVFLGTNLPTIKDVDHDLGVTLDFTYASSHLWKGFDIFANNKSAFYTSADIDFWGTGFGMNFLWSRPFGSGYEDWEWLVYSPYYYNALWQDTPYQMDYKFGWRYYNHPDGSANHSCHPRDLGIQRAYGRVSLPEICPAGIVPYYEFAKIWPDEGGKYDDGYPRSYWRNYGNWFHTFGLYKGWTVQGFLPNQSEQVIHTGFEMVYNDGTGPTPDSRRDNADHDWSHCVFSLSTDFYLRPNVTFIPAIYYQSSWDDSVNTDDEFWFTLSMRLIF